MFSAVLHNEVGWFDEKENSVDTLSMRLANDATFVRAAFSNRLPTFIQARAAVIVAALIGMLLGWRLALVALATLPILVVSAIAQKLWFAGFSRGYTGNAQENIFDKNKTKISGDSKSFS